jgi:hypothetical protein
MFLALVAYETWTKGVLVTYVDDVAVFDVWGSLEGDGVVWIGRMVVRRRGWMWRRG